MSAKMTIFTVLLKLFMANKKNIQEKPKQGGFNRTNGLSSYGYDCQFFGRLDGTVVNLALPKMISDLT